MLIIANSICFFEPIQERYQSEVILPEDASISPLDFPALIIAIADIFPPVITKS
jgi:Uma2 family endonuclease